MIVAQSESCLPLKNTSIEEEKEDKEETLTSLLKKLKEEVDFQEQKIPQMIRNNPENVKYTMIEETKDLIGEFGSLRMKILK
jgi:hypothetical protein